MNVFNSARLVHGDSTGTFMLHSFISRKIIRIWLFQSRLTNLNRTKWAPGKERSTCLTIKWLFIAVVAWVSVLPLCSFSRPSLMGWTNKTLGRLWILSKRATSPLPGSMHITLKIKTVVKIELTLLLMNQINCLQTKCAYVDPSSAYCYKTQLIPLGFDISIFFKQRNAGSDHVIPK